MELQQLIYFSFGALFAFIHLSHSAFQWRGLQLRYILLEFLVALLVLFGWPVVVPVLVLGLHVLGKIEGQRVVTRGAGGYAVAHLSLTSLLVGVYLNPQPCQTSLLICLPLLQLEYSWYQVNEAAPVPLVCTCHRITDRDPACPQHKTDE